MIKTIFGPPGTGKTTTLINIVKDEIERGTPPDRIAFVSFSRKAAEEARDRAASELNISNDEMVWFRTLHSMAFQYLALNPRDVLRGADYNSLGSMLGLEFTSNASISMADGALYAQGKSGDAYLGMIQKARVREVSLEKQFNDEADWRLHYQQAKVIDNAVRAYKNAFHKKDFVDMIEDFIDQGVGPILDVLIVDEAQDLSPLQWRMVHEVLKPNAKRVYFAGDDDQCIYSWMGVRVMDFLEASDEKQILQQSYRIPSSVHDLAADLIGRVDIRQTKLWNPTEHRGTVVWHRDIMDVDIQTGEWLILARTNYIANQVANELRDEGYLFWREGSGWSISPNVLFGIEVWLRLCKGEYLSANELQKFSKQLRTEVITKAGKKILGSLDTEATYTLQDLIEKCDLQANSSTPWYDVIKVSERERIYISSVRRRGEKILTAKPRVKISTIHKAKGGEADNVLLLLDSSRACALSEDQDSEIRTFYVGMTRAKKALHIVEPRNKYGFEL